MKYTDAQLGYLHCGESDCEVLFVKAEDDCPAWLAELAVGAVQDCLYVDFLTNEGKAVRLSPQEGRQLSYAITTWLARRECCI